MANCKRCNLPIRWIRDNDKWKCLNPDDTAHWDTCSAARWRRVVSEGQRFERPMETGYRHDGKDKYESKTAAVRRATDLSLPACGCAAPPWEDCEHTRGDDLVLEVLDGMKAMPTVGEDGWTAWRSRPGALGLVWERERVRR